MILHAPMIDEIAAQGSVLMSPSLLLSMPTKLFVWLVLIAEEVFVDAAGWSEYDEPL